MHTSRRERNTLSTSHKPLSCSLSNLLNNSPSHCTNRETRTIIIRIVFRVVSLIYWYQSDRQIFVPFHIKRGNTKMHIKRHCNKVKNPTTNEVPIIQSPTTTTKWLSQSQKYAQNFFDFKTDSKSTEGLHLQKKTVTIHTQKNFIFEPRSQGTH